MRNTLTLFTAAVLLAGTALAGPAVARDRTDRPKLTANQMTEPCGLCRARFAQASLRSCSGEAWCQGRHPKILLNH